MYAIEFETAISNGIVQIPETFKQLYSSPNAKVIIMVDEPTKQQGNVLQKIASQAQDLGVSDLAQQHDHYIYGTAKND
jgi:hypothetical protein